MRRTNNEKNKLSVRQIRNIYKQRWGIEVEFRGLKQTLDKAELRCRNEVRIRTELHWSLMAMTIAELFELKVQLGEPPAACPFEFQTPPVELSTIPQKRSLAETVRALGWSLHHLSETPLVVESLPAKLWRAKTDSYERQGSKPAADCKTKRLLHQCLICSGSQNPLSEPITLHRLSASGITQARHYAARRS